MGMSMPMTAGAIISGAYFGDKISPLSDTTNLAPAVAGANLYDHIKHMLWTTIPSITITLIVFTILGLNVDSVGNMAIKDQTLLAITENFNTSIWLLAPLVVVIGLALFKARPFPTILGGAVAGGIVAVIFQQEQIIQFVDRADLSHGLVMLAGVWKAMYTGFTTTTGFETIDELVNRGGMNSMLEVIWLILSALMFGGVMEETGLLNRLVVSLLRMVSGTGSLIATTIFTGFATNIVASDQYMAIVLPGRMFRLEYEKRNLSPENLSRALEDSGTLTSALIPWNTCGAYMSGTLGVSTMAYLPYAIFNYINPIISIIMAYTGFSIKKIEK
jgi:NhaC family Na+:H+ antiporter